MTTVQPAYPSRAPADAALLDAVAALREVASTHAVESERLRTLAPSVLASLRGSGLLGFAVPTELGGGGHGPRTQLTVIEAMAHTETTTAWSLMISAMLSAIAGAYLPEEGAREVFCDGIPTCAGLLMPSGVLVPAAGGFRARGRWAFGSGIRHATWIVTSAIVQRPLHETQSGAPELRTIVVPADDVIIEDTWHAAGLRGTGSEHYRIEDVFVPEARTSVFPTATAQRGGPSFDLPLMALLGPAHAGFALGAARAALDAVTRLAPERIKAWPGVKLGAHAGFHMELGRADAKLLAARALAYQAAELLEERCARGHALANEDWRTARLAVTHATEVSAEVATFAFRAGGASALYETSPLQRLFRDIQAAALHVAATDDAYEFAGRVLLGTAAPHPLLAPRAARAI